MNDIYREEEEEEEIYSEYNLFCFYSNTYPQQEAAKRYTPDVRGNTVFGYAA